MEYIIGEKGSVIYGSGNRLCSGRLCRIDGRYRAGVPDAGASHGGQPGRVRQRGLETNMVCLSSVGSSLHCFFTNI